MASPPFSPSPLGCKPLFGIRSSPSHAREPAVRARPANTFCEHSHSLAPILFVFPYQRTRACRGPLFRKLSTCVDSRDESILQRYAPARSLPFAHSLRARQSESDSCRSARCIAANSKPRCSSHRPSRTQTDRQTDGSSLDLICVGSRVLSDNRWTCTTSDGEVRRADRRRAPGGEGDLQLGAATRIISKPPRVGSARCRRRPIDHRPAVSVTFMNDGGGRYKSTWMAMGGHRTSTTGIPRLCDSRPDRHLSRP
ncbi:hypothetical protein C8Q80DRAFT_380383 [Daedaleopsis nitida]|nr:hypothetical protein C8Q80DRAFT_380383 [Daedaleopsis nitida]